MCTHLLAQWRLAAAKNFVAVTGTEVQVFREKDPAAIGCGSPGAEYVCESTGVFKVRKKAAELHLKRGVNRLSSLFRRRTPCRSTSWA